MSSEHSAPSARVKVRRIAERGEYDPAIVTAILDEALVAHVGVSTPDGPIVIPMLPAHDGEQLYLHGAAANHLLKSGGSQQICVTATLLDGLVIARSAFHHSMNYRSVVVRGEARVVVDDAEKIHASRLLTDRVGVGRYDDCRPPTPTELKATRMLALPLAEASAKIRAEGVNDEPDDLGLPYWAGVIPITRAFGEPQPSDDLDSTTSCPAYLPNTPASNQHSP